VIKIFTPDDNDMDTNTDTYMNDLDAHIAKTAMENAYKFIEYSDYTPSRGDWARMTGGGGVTLSVRYRGNGLDDATRTCTSGDIDTLSIKEARDVMTILIMELAKSCKPIIRAKGFVPGVTELPTVHSLTFITRRNDLLTSIIAARDHLTTRLAEPA
jgi:hypothetical protein